VLNYDERLAQLRQHGMGDSKAEVILDGFAEAAQRSVSEFRTKVDVARLEQAVDLLAHADTIYLIGLRRSFPIASYLAYAMGKLGIRTVLVDGVAGLGVEQAGFIGPRDAVLAVSFTPYASETVTLVTLARRQHARIVSVTDSPFSPIAGIADVWLEVVEANFEGFRSITATMVLAMTLSVAIAGRRGDR
jgi:DNA-binding MurR/RpiR family transcriptional regulator